jgi:hypothetical protein
MMPAKRIDMRRSLRLSAILCVVWCVIGPITSALAAPKASAKVGASSVWQLPEQFMTGAHAACDKSAPAGFGQCVIEQMGKAGASADAVSFTRELYKQSGGDVGITTGFQGVGPVDFAWITYPLRANTNYGLLLVNGKPPIVNVENLTLLDRKQCSRRLSSRTLSFSFHKLTCGQAIATERPGPTHKPVRVAACSSRSVIR